LYVRYLYASEAYKYRTYSVQRAKKVRRILGEKGIFGVNDGTVLPLWDGKKRMRPNLRSAVSEKTLRSRLPPLFVQRRKRR
ncbi:MAG: hypothetical protein IJT04_07950, partial [Bacteroidales bacterium]|nr:hypothetical protein [Bacteroidales bacterium]